MLVRLKQKLKKFTGASDGTDGVAQKAEECTSEYLLTEDWKSNMELCDMINDGAEIAYVLAPVCHANPQRHLAFSGAVTAQQRYKRCVYL